MSGAKFVAVDSKATKRPSLEIEGAKLDLSPCTPPVPSDARRVDRSVRSKTKTSFVPFVSSATIPSENASYATKRPSPEIDGECAVGTTAPKRSRARISALDENRSNDHTPEFPWKTTYRPSAEILGLRPPPAFTDSGGEIRVVRPPHRSRRYT